MTVEMTKRGNTAAQKRGAAVTGTDSPGLYTGAQSYWPVAIVVYDSFGNLFQDGTFSEAVGRRRGRRSGATSAGGYAPR